MSKLVLKNGGGNEVARQGGKPSQAVNDCFDRSKFFDPLAMQLEWVKGQLAGTNNTHCLAYRIKSDPSYTEAYAAIFASRGDIVIFRRAVEVVKYAHENGVDVSCLRCALDETAKLCRESDPTRAELARGLLKFILETKPTGNFSSSLLAGCDGKGEKPAAPAAAEKTTASEQYREWVKGELLSGNIAYISLLINSTPSKLRHISSLLLGNEPEVYKPAADAVVAAYELGYANLRALMPTLSDMVVNGSNEQKDIAACIFQRLLESKCATSYPKKGKILAIAGECSNKALRQPFMGGV